MRTKSIWPTSKLTLTKSQVPSVEIRETSFLTCRIWLIGFIFTFHILKVYTFKLIFVYSSCSTRLMQKLEANGWQELLQYSM
jgi:hypothetical protein